MVRSAHASIRSSLLKRLFFGNLTGILRSNSHFEQGKGKNADLPAQKFTTPAEPESPQQSAQ